MSGNTMDIVLRVEGKVTETNFAEYKEMILARVDQVNLDPQTDDEFAEAEQTIKAFAEAEKAIDEARERAMDETAEIREVFAAMTEVADKLREVRVELNRKVKAAKEKKKKEAVAAAVKRVENHCQHLYKSHPYIPIGTFHVVAAEIAEAGKGKKKAETYIKAIEQKSDEICAQFNELAELCHVNYGIIAEVGRESLFPDKGLLIKKPTNELLAIIETRIAKEELEQKRQEERRKEQERKKREKQSAVIPPPEPPAKPMKGCGVVDAGGVELPDPMPGTTVDQQDMINDTITSPAHAVDDAPANGAGSGYGLFQMVISFAGEVEKIKSIAREVDSIVSKYDEVQTIHLKMV